MSLSAKKIFLSIGESMLEFSRRDDDAWRLGFAGDTLNTAWYFRMSAPGSAWDVAYFTRLGADPYSRRMAAFLAENGIATRWIDYDADRQPGLYLIDTENGERSFTYWRGQSAARRQRATPGSGAGQRRRDLFFRHNAGDPVSPGATDAAAHPGNGESRRQARRLRPEHPATVMGGCRSNA